MATAASFLTDIDPRAAVRGSRDPLGLVPLWSRLGREVVGNLTTVTTSYRNFTTLLIGQFLADQAVGRGADERERVNAFLRAEQLILYSRVAHRGPDEVDRILGITRIRKRLDPRSPRLTISSKPAHQVLADQKVYGLWGLYSVGARRSGLVDADVNRPSAAGMEHLERDVFPALEAACGRELRKLLPLIEDGSAFEPRGRHEAVARALAAVHRPEPRATERALYLDALVRGTLLDQTGCRQARLWERLVELNDDGPFSWDEAITLAEVTEAAKRARAAGDAELADDLDAIATVEPLLALAPRLLGLVLDRDSQAPDSVADEVTRTWPEPLAHLRVEALRDLRPTMAAAIGTEGADELTALAVALATGDHRAAVSHCIERNASVMRERGAAAWVTVRDDRLDVRLSQGDAGLPTPDELPTLWENTYFIQSLKSVGAQVTGRIR